MIHALFALQCLRLTIPALANELKLKCHILIEAQFEGWSCLLKTQYVCITY